MIKLVGILVNLIFQSFFASKKLPDSKKFTRVTKKFLEENRIKRNENGYRNFIKDLFIELVFILESRKWTGWATNPKDWFSGFVLLESEYEKIMREEEKQLPGTLPGKHKDWPIHNNYKWYKKD